MTKIRATKSAAIAALFLVFANNAFSDATDWSAGLDSFASDDYASALWHFESARNAGLDSAAVHYNIAVCQFKLGRYVRARNEFQLIAERYPKMRGLAEYNLGLVARRRNDPTAATDHFIKAYRLSPDNEKLRIMSSNRLRELEPELRRASRWTGAIGVRAGFDDNVALRDETGLPSTLTTESPMVDFFAWITGPFNGESGFRVDAGIYAIRNFDADEFDQTEIFGGVMYDWRPGDWRLQFGTRLSTGALGGDAFDRKAGVNLRVIRYLGNNASLSLGYRYDDVQDVNVAFAGIAGTRQQIQVQYQWYSDVHRFVLRYRQEENERIDPGVSPRRTGFGADYRYQPESGWGYESGIDFRSSDYNNLLIPRSEDLLTVYAAVTRTFAKSWRLRFGYRYSNNDSSDPVFSYDRSQIMVGALKIF
ncbi:MAG: MtrB/PioB family outer membrane beta-barrel protein [Proteobacteria bacterium]|nr:MtrB/PioB family outer membrane beta-barrel protein [Pseudomonadota bacterium]